MSCLVQSNSRGESLYEVSKVLSKVQVAAGLLTAINITALSPNIDFTLLHFKFALCVKRYGLLPDSRPIVLLILKQSRRDSLKIALQPADHRPGSVKPCRTEGTVPLATPSVHQENCAYLEL